MTIWGLRLQGLDTWPALAEGRDALSCAFSNSRQLHPGRTSFPVQNPAGVVISVLTVS
jgi:hypothetical protein